jgi:poly(hydroxyalkanoate) granule-associated protein
MENNMPTQPKEKAAEEPKEEGQYPMSEMLRKLFLATIGAVAIAQEEMEALIKRLVERGELAEKDGKKLIHEMKEKRKTKTADVSDEISKNIEGVLSRMSIPSKADVEALGQKITGLSKKIDDLKKPQ